MRWIVVVVALAIVADRPARACTFCGGLASRQTLRQHFQRATYIAYGQLANPRFDPNGGRGSTELRVGRVLKSDPAIGNRELVLLPRYLPVIGNTPPDYLVFCVLADGKLDPLHGVPASAAVVEYVLGAAKLDEKNVAVRLGYAFKFLDAADPIVAGDAFLEFARASDVELVKARAALDPAKLRHLMTAASTAPEKLGVFAMLLGLSGGRADAELLAGFLRQPLSDRVRENLGGFLAGLTILDPAAGWSAIEGVLDDPRKPFDQRLAAIGTVRFFQATREAEAKPHVLRCYRGLLAGGDLADLAVDDLRRWGWWDLTAEVLKYFERPSHSAPVVRRAIVRYALQCPGDEAKQFVAGVRRTDPQLVARVEDFLQLYNPVKR
jgi:hypothetical protein